MFSQFDGKKNLPALYTKYDTNEKLIINDSKYLREWIGKQLHLPNITEDVLLNILLRCKNSLEMTKKHIESGYIVKAMYPEIYSNWDPFSPDLKDTFKNSSIHILMPKLTGDEKSVIVFKVFKDKNDYHPTYENYMKVAQMINFVLLMKGQAKGYIIIIDFENMDARRVSIAMCNMKKTAIINKVLPASGIDKIILLNLNSIVGNFVSLFKTAIPSKVNDRILIWSKSSSELHEILPKEVLPSNFGGILPDIETIRDNFVEFIQNNREVLINESKNVADLQKIPKESISELNDLDFGMKGSFRNLQVD